MSSEPLRVGLRELQRGALGELGARVRYSGERAVVTSHGKPLCAVVSLEDLERLEGRAIGGDK